MSGLHTRVEAYQCTQLQVVFHLIPLLVNSLNSGLFSASQQVCVHAFSVLAGRPPCRVSMPGFDPSIYAGRCDPGVLANIYRCSVQIEIIHMERGPVPMSS